MIDKIKKALKYSPRADAKDFLASLNSEIKKYEFGLIESIELDRFINTLVKNNPWINEPSDLERLRAENELLRDALADAIMQLEASIPSTKRRGIIPLLFLEGKIEQYKKALL